MRTRDHYMAGRRWLAPLLLFAALIYGILSAICWPTTYTLSHLVIDYHFGFGKRGLIGVILRLIDRPPYHFITLAWMSFSVLALWLALLAGAARHAIRMDAGTASAFFVFFLSAGFACLVDDVGRGEHFGLLLAMPCLIMPVGMPWLPVRMVLLVAAVLMQELNFLLVVPIVAFDNWVGWQAASKSRPLLYTIIAAMPAAALTWSLGNSRTACDTLSATAYFQGLAADFQIQTRPVLTLCADAAMNVQAVAHSLEYPTIAVAIPLALSVAVPSAVFNLMLTRRALRGRSFGVIAAVVAGLAPLGLLLFGFDTVRFITLIQVSSLLVLVSAVRRLGVPVEGTLPSASYRMPLVVALVAFELGSSVTLNNGGQASKFPFMPLVQIAFEVAQGRRPFVVIH